MNNIKDPCGFIRRQTRGAYLDIVLARTIPTRWFISLSSTKSGGEGREEPHSLATGAGGGTGRLAG